MAVTYEYYSRTYGGDLPEAAFSSCVGLAEAHVRWLCAVKGICCTATPYKRAVCSACEAFAEYGAGEVGGYSIGEFSVKNYASQETSGEQLATQAALRELVGTGATFAGVR